MWTTDIAIIGGGLAGSSAAAMLGRAGIDAVLIDPHAVYPPDFRCEKISGPQLKTIHKMGLYDAVRKASTLDHSVWTARFGCIVDKRPSDQHGVIYDDLVNAIRGEIPATVATIEAKATGIETSDDRQLVSLSNGMTVSARLIVLANGLNIGLRHTIGIDCHVKSSCHSITVGFNLSPCDRDRFAFPALTYFGESLATRMAYLTLFPVGSAMRANLMVYRDMDDPWLSRMRRTPEAALQEIMPNLHKITGAIKVNGPIKIRPADLCETQGHRQAGVVLVGDAFATSCPAAGTGTRKVFTDVERLCNAYIPAWLATGGMGVGKISAFYDDPVKRSCDKISSDEAYHLKSMSIEPGLPWSIRRWLHYAVRRILGLLRYVSGVISEGAAAQH